MSRVFFTYRGQQKYLFLRMPGEGKNFYNLRFSYSESSCLIYQEYIQFAGELQKDHPFDEDGFSGKIGYPCRYRRRRGYGKGAVACDQKHRYSDFYVPRNDVAQNRQN